MSMSEHLQKIYNEYKNEPMVGMFARKTPILLLNDAKLIKDVLIRDFTKFADRGFPNVERVWKYELFTHRPDLSYENSSI